MDAYRTTAWAIDFIRALNQRPIFFKLLLRFVLGKHAYNELFGMIESLRKDGICEDIGYDLHGMDYRNDRVKLRWWVDERNDS